MNKTVAVAALAVVAAAFIVTPAQAQEIKPMGLSVRAGIFLPQKDLAKNAGKQWFSGGVEYKLGDLKIRLLALKEHL